MSERLRSRTVDPKWTVFRSDTREWSVYIAPGESWFALSFETHAEAIAWAQAQARKES